MFRTTSDENRRCVQEPMTVPGQARRTNNSGIRCRRRLYIGQAFPSLESGFFGLSARGQIAGAKSLACRADPYAEVSPFVRLSLARLVGRDRGVRADSLMRYTASHLSSHTNVSMSTHRSAPILSRHHCLDGGDWRRDHLRPTSHVRPLQPGEFCDRASDTQDWLNHTYRSMRK
jgi:hypothetical protein